jgi:hypothetical protein
MLSHVRDSGSVKVIRVLTSVDSVSPGYGSSSVRESILDARGERVIRSGMVMGGSTSFIAVRK